MPCCDSNGDVRGMCFVCIGGLDSITADAITKVRACPNKAYAIAYWVWNNQVSDWHKHEQIKLLTDEKDWYQIAKMIHNMTYNDSDDEDD